MVLTHAHVLGKEKEKVFFFCYRWISTMKTKLNYRPYGTAIEKIPSAIVYVRCWLGFIFFLNFVVSGMTIWICCFLVY